MGKEGKAKGRRGTGGGEVGSDRRRRRHRRSSGPKPCASLPASLSAPDSFKILLLLLTLQFRGESETKGRTTAAEQKAGNRVPRGRAHGPAPRGRRPALPELQPLQPATPGFVQSSHLLEWEDESGSCDSVMAGGGNSFPNLKRSFRMIQGKKKKKPNDWEQHGRAQVIRFLTFLPDSSPAPFSRTTGSGRTQSSRALRLAWQFAPLCIL